MEKRNFLGRVLIGILLVLLGGITYYYVNPSEEVSKKDNEQDTKVIQNIDFDKASILVSKLGLIPFGLPYKTENIIIEELNDAAKEYLVLCSLINPFAGLDDNLTPHCYYATSSYEVRILQAAEALFGKYDFKYCNEDIGTLDFLEDNECYYGSTGVGIYPPVFYRYSKWLNFEENDDEAMISGKFSYIKTELSKKQIEWVNDHSDETTNIKTEEYEDIALYNLSDAKPIATNLNKLLTKEEVFKQFSDKIYEYKFYFKRVNNDYILDRVQISK